MFILPMPSYTRYNTNKSTTVKLGQTKITFTLSLIATQLEQVCVSTVSVLIRSVAGNTGSSKTKPRAAELNVS
jgi:hypothetical protein